MRTKKGIMHVFLKKKCITHTPHAAEAHLQSKHDIHGTQSQDDQILSRLQTSSIPKKTAQLQHM